MGGRIGYSLVTGVIILLLSCLGLLSLLLAIIPAVAILPILLYIGMLIGAQAFQESPAKHAHAVILAIVPHLAAWGKNQVDSALNAAGTSVAAVGADNLASAGVLYHGLEVLGGGAILSGIMFAAIAVAVIDQTLKRAAAFALTASLLSFFGLMHSEAVGIAVAIEPAIAYLCIAALLYVSAITAEGGEQPETLA